MNVQDFLKQKANITLSSGVTPSNCKGLTKAAAASQQQLIGHLYDAVVGLYNNTKLESRLNATQLQLLQDLSKQAIERTSNNKTAESLREFEFMCERYSDLFEDAKTNGQVKIIKKKPVSSIFPHAVPKHTLVCDGKHLFEQLTWMSTDEIERFNDRYADVEGIASLAVETKKFVKLFGTKTQVVKTNLGHGAFGVVRVGRLVNSDEYIAVKKCHPIRSVPKPLKIQAGLNDGSQSGIVKVHASFPVQSSRHAAAAYEPNSTITYTELGVVDLQNFLDDFRTLRYLFEGGISDNELLTEMASGCARTATSGDSSLLNLTRLTASPFRDSTLTRKFLNRMAYQMLEAIDQMHKAGIAHNDIKPNNFVLAKQRGEYRVKLIDFDMSTDAKSGIGVPRENYATIYASPQVRSSEANNQPMSNDAYSAGMSIRQVNGDHMVDLAMFREKIKGSLKNQMPRKGKPVEDRRRIEAQQISMPELSNLNQLADLLCHPKAGKRISVREALLNPVFCQPGAMISNEEFSQLCTEAIWHGHLFSERLMHQLYGATNTHERIEQEVDISAVNRQVTEEIHLNEYKARHGEQALTQAKQQAEKRVHQSNLQALPRRTARALNPVNLFKSPGQKDADYTFKPLAGK